MKVTRPLLSCTMRSRMRVAVSSLSTTIWKRLQGQGGLSVHQDWEMQSSRSPGSGGDLDGRLVTLLHLEELVERAVEAVQAELIGDRPRRAQAIRRVAVHGRRDRALGALELLVRVARLRVELRLRLPQVPAGTQTSAQRQHGVEESRRTSAARSSRQTAP